MPRILVWSSSGSSGSGLLLGNIRWRGVLMCRQRQGGEEFAFSEGSESAACLGGGFGGSGHGFMWVLCFQEPG